MHHRLAHAHELLDEGQHDRAELEQSLDQVAEVNRLLGGHRAVLLALAPFADGTMRPGSGPLRVLDIGTGSADVPIAIAAWARSRGRAVRIEAADVHPQMRDIARERTRGADDIRIGAADALALPYRDDAFDVALLSLTLHHFEDAGQLAAVREAARVARHAVIINELERCWQNLAGARLLALTRWRGNRLTRHDGPLSVLRAFRQHELGALAARAGLPVLSMRRRFFYRLVLVLDARRASAARTELK